MELLMSRIWVTADRFTAVNQAREASVLGSRFSIGVCTANISLLINNFNLDDRSQT